MNIIELKSVSKSYSDGRSQRCVIKNLDFSVDEGEFIAILGRSGSGKSTLLNLIAGLDSVDTGTVLVSGKEISSSNYNAAAHARLKSIGFVFQFFNLLPTLTLIENIKVPGYIAEMSPRDVQARAEECAELVGLKEALNLRPNEASGGEAQRAAIARAIFHRPPCILADEPTGNLDRGNADNIVQLFSRLVREHGHSVLMVTHDQSISQYATRAYNLSGGKLWA